MFGISTKNLAHPTKWRASGEPMNKVNDGIRWGLMRAGANKAGDKLNQAYDWTAGHLKSPTIPTPKAPPPPPDEFAIFLREMSRQATDARLRASKRSSYLGLGLGIAGPNTGGW